MYILHNSLKMHPIYIVKAPMSALA